MSSRARALCVACRALRLSEAMGGFDPRLTPARADLAAKELEGKVVATRFVEGRVYEVVEPLAPLRLEPSPDAPLATQALKGERVVIYDMNAEGWAWGQLASTIMSVGCRPMRWCRSDRRRRIK